MRRRANRNEVRPPGANNSKLRVYSSTDRRGSTLENSERTGRAQRIRHRLYNIIFEADTAAGKFFDILILVLITLSVIAAILESVHPIEARFGHLLRAAEWGFTLMFTVEYIARLISVKRPWRYATSFYGIVDLLAIIPTYLSIVVPDAHSLIVIRALRLLRIFRVLKITRYLDEITALMIAIRATRVKITVFLLTVLTLALIMGTLMYVIEGDEESFSSIPRGLYWAVVTITTVGYGDIAPQTAMGQAVAAFAMVLGYSLIIIPTGIFAGELLKKSQKEPSARVCMSCSLGGHDDDAQFCKHCGVSLSDSP